MIPNGHKFRIGTYLGKTVTVSFGEPSVPTKGTSFRIGFFDTGNHRIRAYAIDMEQSGSSGITDCPGFFTGRVIGILCKKRNRSGQPVALIVAKDGVSYHQAELAEIILTEEEAKYFSILPLYHKSCGAIVFRYRKDSLEFLLLHEHGSDTWGFPKGHMEMGESETDTANREIFEEAGFHPSFLPEFREEIHYQISGAGEKTVVLFLTEYNGPVRINKSEISDFIWVPASGVRVYSRRANLTRMIELAEKKILAYR